jgi:ribosomal protein S18 acetylase RimI-like enzyme
VYRKAAIRPFRREDEAILFGLARSALGAIAGHVPRALSSVSAQVVFVAEVGGAPAGYEALGRAGRAVRIEQLVVGAEHDDEGIEDQLVAYAEGFAISTGAHTLQAVVEADNRVARAFYRDRGFVACAPELVELVLPRRA